MTKCRFLGKDRKSSIGVAETSFSNSIIPFFTIPLLYIVIPEYTKYPSDLTGYSPQYTVVLVFLCGSIAVAKLIDRACKFSLVSQTSTMFFGSVDCAMKVVAGLGAIVFFNAELRWTEIVGFIIIILSFVPMRYGSHKEKAKQGSNIPIFDESISYDELRTDDDGTDQVTAANRGCSSCGIKSPLLSSDGNPVLSSEPVDAMQTSLHSTL